MRAALSEPRVALPVGATLGEGPVWIARDAALWFTDIKRRLVHRFDPATGAHRSIAAPDQPGFVQPLAVGGLVTGLPDGLHRLDPDTGAFSPWLAVELDRPGNRLNDATVDAAGRLWFGTMDDAEAGGAGRFWRLDTDATLHDAGGAATITNGPALSPDGRTLYQVDTLGRNVDACAIGPDGAILDRRRFCTLEPGAGNPDGPAVDAEGCVWIALYGGWGLRRYAPDGALLETVPLPVANVTKLAFGGPGLATAFVTTARHLADAEALAAQPDAGHLFAFDVAVPGLPGHLVAARP